MGDDNDGYLGLGASAFFSSYGFGFFGGYQLNENLEIGGFAGAVIDIASSGPPGDDLYKSSDDGDALAQFGISYLF